MEKHTQQAIEQHTTTIRSLVIIIIIIIIMVIFKCYFSGELIALSLKKISFKKKKKNQQQ